MDRIQTQLMRTEVTETTMGFLTVVTSESPRGRGIISERGLDGAILHEDRVGPYRKGKGITYR